jgi:hypothetical protein
MSLIVLVMPAWADRIVWPTPPTPEQEAEAARRHPGATSVLVGSLGAPEPPSPLPDPAVQRLRSELEAAIPQFAEFDGELRVMARLQKAIADVHQVRTPEERALLARAMLIQGYAVRRYYQDQIATEPGAAPYRSAAGYPASWENAVALGAGTELPTDDITQAAERLVFDTVRAAVLARPGSSITTGTLAEGAVLEVDGVRTTDNPVVVTPGRHFVRVLVGEDVVSWVDRDLAPGETFRIDAPIGPGERTALFAQARNGAALPAAVRSVVDAEPTWIATPGRSVTFVRVDHGFYEQEGTTSHVGPEAWVGVGAGWFSTGDFYRLNFPAGAKATGSTVNAVTPTVALGAGIRVQSLAFGLGADLQYGTGDFHELPTGTTSTRAFTWLHVDAGTEWVRLSAGPLFPWHLGLGAQVHIPLWHGLALLGGGAYGLPLPLDRDTGGTFTPDDTWSAWGGVGYILGKRG